MTPEADATYSGRDNLEAMKQATRYNRFLVDLVLRHASGERVLDHGAGAGTFARPVSEAGAAVLCMEPDDSLRAALARDGFEVASDLSEVADASVDSAYTLNVLEHIGDDRAALAELFRCLKPGGQLFVYVPAFNVLFSQMDRHVGHYRRYRRTTLLELLREVGFEAGNAAYVDSLGFFATLAYKLLGNRSGSISAGNVSLYDGYVFPLSRAVDRIVAGSFGKNLASVATKPAISGPQ